MPLYEYKKNAANVITVPAEWRDSVMVGSAEVSDFIAARIGERRARKGAIRVAFDGWYGVDWKRVTDGVRAAAQKRGLELAFCQTASLMKSPEEIDAYKASWREAYSPMFHYYRAVPAPGRSKEPGRVEKRPV